MSEDTIIGYIEPDEATIKRNLKTKKEKANTLAVVNKVLNNVELTGEDKSYAETKSFRLILGKAKARIKRENREKDRELALMDKITDLQSKLEQKINALEVNPIIKLTSQVVATSAPVQTSVSLPPLNAYRRR